MTSADIADPQAVCEYFTLIFSYGVGCYLAPPANNEIMERGVSHAELVGTQANDAAHLNCWTFVCWLLVAVEFVALLSATSEFRS